MAFIACLLQGETPVQRCERQPRVLVPFLVYISTVTLSAYIWNVIQFTAPGPSYTA